MSNFSSKTLQKKKKPDRGVKRKISYAIWHNNFNRVKELLTPEINTPHHESLLKYILILSLIYSDSEIFDYISNTLNIKYENDDINHFLLNKILYYFDHNNFSKYDKRILMILSSIKNINHQDINGDTLLHEYINIIVNRYNYYVDDNRNSHKVIYFNNILKLLLYNGANPHIKNKRNQSPISMVLEYKNSYNYIKLLLNDNKISKYIEFDILEHFIEYNKDINDHFRNMTVLSHIMPYIPMHHVNLCL